MVKPERVTVTDSRFSLPHPVLTLLLFFSLVSAPIQPLFSFLINDPIQCLFPLLVITCSVITSLNITHAANKKSLHAHTKVVSLNWREHNGLDL